MFSRKIGIDLGTCNSLVFAPGKEIIINEPSVVAVSVSENKILAVGKEAKEMLGRTPDEITVYRPLKDGVIAEYRITEAMFRYFIEKSPGLRFVKPEFMVGVPAGITSTEKRAVIEAGLSAGARNVYVVKEPILAAIGAGIPIASCSGHMVVDIGGGTTEVAVISLGGVVVARSLRIAGDAMDFNISNYIKNKHNIALGEKSVEEIKISIATAIQEKEEMIMEARGRGLASGLPKTIQISSNEICEAIKEPLEEIVKVVKQVLRETPPELSADIMDKGMVLTGGGALLRNIDVYITEKTGVPSFIAEDALLCVARGAGVVIDNLDAYKKSIIK
ncbi:MAG: rod shape-determining protein [Patescibacteria group bacterium]|nr:rod shape-determining protein [Patescibacteria group bacterium]